MRTQLIVACLVVFAFLAGCGKYVSPVVRTALNDLVAIEVEVQQAHAGSIDRAEWNKRTGVLMSQVNDIQMMVKGGATGTAQRDVARMARSLRDMINLVGQKPPTEAAPPDAEPAGTAPGDPVSREEVSADKAAANEVPAGKQPVKAAANTPSEFERLSKSFRDYRKAASKKLGTW